MRFKKIRGHSRIQQNIRKWIDSNCDIDIEALKEFNFQYVKIDLLPWLNLPSRNSQLREPNSITKSMILDGLEIIYDSWKSQLVKLGEPYYLKILLNEPRITKSEIICGIRENIEKYENSFHKIKVDNNKSNILCQMNHDFKWECALDEDFIFESDISSSENYLNINEYYSDRRLINRSKKEKLRSKNLKNSNGEIDTIYFIPKGKIWIGEK